MRYINQTPLEMFLRAYVRQHRRYKENLAALNKGLTRIKEAIHSSCCDDPAAVVSLHTPKETGFTMSIKALLIVSRHSKQSLQRSQKILSDYINGSCCPEQNI